MTNEAREKKRLPAWFKVRAPGGENYRALRSIMRAQKLHTVCEEAQCPNIGECWERKSATFMILGDICTRACRYCAVTSGKPGPVDLDEPERLAHTVANLDLEYCVITSVDRDDLSDGGAFLFAECITKIKNRLPKCSVEVLTPDFGGKWWALSGVMQAKPDVLNHNIETVRSLFTKVRAKGNYDLTLEYLAKAKEIDSSIATKSGIMVGLGETKDELIATMEDLRAVDCNLLTIGQYLQPSKKHIPINRFYTPEEFKELEKIGLEMGFNHVASGPLVRSSYHADDQHRAAKMASVR